MFVDRMPARVQGLVHAVALAAFAAFLVGPIEPAIAHVESAWIVASPALEIPAGARVAAIAAGLILMLAIVVV